MAWNLFNWMSARCQRDQSPSDWDPDIYTTSNHPYMHSGTWAPVLGSFKGYHNDANTSPQRKSSYNAPPQSLQTDVPSCVTNHMALLRQAVFMLCHLGFRVISILIPTPPFAMLCIGHNNMGCQLPAEFCRSHSSADNPESAQR